MARPELTDERLVVDACELRYRIAGEGTPVVLVHGLGLSGELWNRVVDAFGPGYRLVLVTLRGAPGTRELEQKELSLEQWASDLGGLLDELGLDRPVLVGHSLGASIAVKLALVRPHHVRALVLVGADANLTNLAPRMLAAVERIRELGLDGWVEQYWSQNPPFSTASLERAPELLDEYRGLLLENDPEDYARQCLAIAEAENLEARLGDVTQPALVLVGGSDDRTLPEQGRRLAAELPAGRAVELPDVGHTLPLEAPEAVAAAVRAFLEELPPESGEPPRVLRADTTPRNPREGPFGHLDVRWVVGSQTGASLIAFGQSTYPKGATHENHYHPHAEEVVMVVSGRGTQIVGDTPLDVGPGDICFIPRSTPHRITGTSEEDLVILWAFGGAADVEQAGYVPLPD